MTGPPGTGKSHLAQALARALIHQGHRVLYREAHVLLDELADAALAGARRERMAKLAAVPCLIIDDLAMRKLPATAAEDLLELIQRRSSAARLSAVRRSGRCTNASPRGLTRGSRD